MLDDLLRGTKDRLLESLVRRAGVALHPTWVTGVGLLVGLVGVGLLAQGQYEWGLLCWLLNRLLDAVDGTVARVHDRQSDLGGYLDILADFTVYGLLPVALVYSVPSEGNYLALALLLTMFYINAASWMYLAAILEKRRVARRAQLTSVEMPAGLIGGVETFVFYCLFILFPAHLLPLFVLMSALVLITIGQRVVWALRVLARH